MGRAAGKPGSAASTEARSLLMVREGVLTAVVKDGSIVVAPGSVVRVRDEEWLVTAVTSTADDSS